MIQALKVCYIFDKWLYKVSHLKTIFVPYSKTTLARQLQEKCQEQNVDLNMTFVDLTKAFSTFCRDGL